MEADVLVVGAGPVGLVLAAELKLAGAQPLVIERLAEPNPDRKSRGIGPLAAEALRRRGLAGQLAEYHEAGLADLRRDHGSDKGHFAHIHKIDLVPADEPGRERSLIWQPDLERLLRKYVAGLGIQVLPEHALTGLVQDDDRVTATADTPSGERRITAGYLVGCDGGRSTVRKLAGFTFPGTEPFMITRAAEVELADASRLPPAGRLRNGALLHGAGPLLGTIEFGDFPEAEDGRAPLTADELTESVRRVSGGDVTITALREGRRFLDHARQAETYRIGRVLLAGDAAHVHSPNGGQGLNLGLMDAVNLGWKLAAGAPGGLLDSYTTERHPVGAAVLRNTRAQSALMMPGPHTDALRDVVSDLMDLPQANAYFAEMMTGLHVRYPMPYAGAHPLLGQHCPNLTVTVRTPTADRRTTLYELAESARPLLLHPADDPAPETGRVTAIPTTAIERPDLDATLIRPDGVVAWASGPDHPSPAGALRAALQHWFGQAP
ncbi:FAD-dependent monooxygenase [Pseudonocardia acaciae]|uniref:FAD-dependent monooxygenase n=1 Tax=Pseudonocardia acaciae TaxID=551276 RepID=UPI00048F51E5|nr:FAD-dependent monooxygenase [Pseudonocardia acaciae]